MFNKNPMILDLLLKDNRIKSNLTNDEIWLISILFASNKTGADPEALIKILANNGYDVNKKKKFENGKIVSVVDFLQNNFDNALKRNDTDNMVRSKNAIDIIKKYSK